MTALYLQAPPSTGAEAAPDVEMKKEALAPQPSASEPADAADETASEKKKKKKEKKVSSPSVHGLRAES